MLDVAAGEVGTVVFRQRVRGLARPSPALADCDFDAAVFVGPRCFDPVEFVEAGEQLRFFFSLIIGPAARDQSVSLVRGQLGLDRRIVGLAGFANDVLDALRIKELGAGALGGHLSLACFAVANVPRAVAIGRGQVDHDLRVSFVGLCERVGGFAAPHEEQSKKRPATMSGGEHGGSPVSRGYHSMLVAGFQQLGSSWRTLLTRLETGRS